MDDAAADVHGVRFSPDGISSAAVGGLSIPRHKIESLTLRYGFHAERPLLQVLIGVPVLWAGAMPIWWLYRFFTEGGMINTVVFYLVTLLPLGAWLVWSGTRRGWYLDVCHDDDRHKFPLTRVTGTDALSGVIQQAGEMGYRVQLAD